MKLPALLRATHFGPTVLVCGISLIFARQLLSWPGSLEVTVAVFLGQCFVGWSNDYLDAERDRVAGRATKPLVSGELSKKTLAVLIPMAFVGAVVTSFVGPFGFRGTVAHVLALLSATAYNLGAKATVFSLIPYAVSFTLFPVAMYSTVDRWPPGWVLVAFISFASAFHFFNTLKDMDADRSQKIMGLPQRLGTRRSVIVAVILILVGLVDLLWFR